VCGVDGGGGAVRRVLCVSVAVLFVTVASCVPPTLGGSAERNTKPLDGKLEHAVLAVKDYEVKGVVFVQSQERLTKIFGSNLVLSGSKITYSMLMREAVKLGADDIINVRVDISTSETKERNKEELTYHYSASALAIKYTKAVVVGTAVQQYFKGMESAVPPEGK